MFSNISIAGRIGADAKTSTKADVTSFRVAVNFKAKGEQQTNWYTVDCWGKLGELAQTYAKKGRVVAVGGALSMEQWMGKDEPQVTLRIRANDFKLLDPKPVDNGEEASPWAEKAAPAPKAETHGFGGVAEEDDGGCPF